MRRSFIIAWALLLAGFACLGQASAFWQSRDSNYNIAVVGSPGFTAFMTWTDYGSHTNTINNQVVWTDYGAHLE